MLDEKQVVFLSWVQRERWRIEPGGESFEVVLVDELLDKFAEVWGIDQKDIEVYKESRD